MSPSYGDDDPIAAYATPLAISALALIRVSGRSTIEKAARLFSRPEKLLEAPGNTLVHGWITAPLSAENGGQGGRVDEVLISVYRAPRSYTGEDALDISCHGGIAAAKAVMRVLRAAGFREALPGEFTFRAFMNGKLDLTRAESVMELVSAKTDSGREHAVRRLSGALEEELNEIKSLLVHVLAGAELYLDYSEDEADAAGGDRSGAAEAADEERGLLPGRSAAEEALTRLRALSAGYKRERLYHEGALVVIAGRPNAGKSSLFNLLVNEDRSIVTDIPGTTRDWIEAWVSLEGIPVRLADTAGLHDSADPVERLGMERSRELLGGADLTLYLIDGIEGVTAEDRDFIRECTASSSGNKPPPILLLWNKADMRPFPGSAEGLSGLSIQELSAKTGEGLTGLSAAITAMLEASCSGPSGGGLAEGGLGGGESADGTQRGAAPGIGTARQKERVDAALAALEEALVLADREEPLDIIAPLLREGVNALGEITGEVSTADILEAVFSDFCVGK